jgi:hypothetical protein
MYVSPTCAERRIRASVVLFAAQTKPTIVSRTAYHGLGACAAWLALTPFPPGGCDCLPLPRISAQSLYSPAFLSCLVYSAFSIIMVLANKLIVTNFGFDSTLVLLVFQNACAVVMTLGGRFAGWLSFEQFQLRTAIQWLPVNILFCIMLFTGFTR